MEKHHNSRKQQLTNAKVDVEKSKIVPSMQRRKYISKIVSKVSEKNIERKRKTKHYHDKSAKTMPQLIIGQPVRVKTHPQLKNSTWKSGTVTNGIGPMSYEVNVNGTSYRGNRIHIHDSMMPQSKKVTTYESCEIADKTPVRCK